MKQLFHDQLRTLKLEKLDKKLAAAMTSSVFVIEAKKTISHFEQFYLPTFRMGISGERTVVLVKMEDLFSYFTSCGSIKIDLQTVATFLKNASPEQLNKFKTNGGKIYYGDLLPGQALYTPPGLLFWEK